MNRLVRRAIVGLGIVFGGIQLIPFGRSHLNPPISQEVAWNTEATRALAKRACFDCHSNETQWPWYASVAPVSWLVQRDVTEGRSKMNFSEWNLPQKEAKHAVEELRDGEMPLWFYVILHPEAKLTATEKDALIAGFQATIGQNAKKPASNGDGR